MSNANAVNETITNPNTNPKPDYSRIVATENISSMVNSMNENGVTSIYVSLQYRVMNKSIECSLAELECADSETTIREFMENKLCNEDYFYDQNPNNLDLCVCVKDWNEEDTIAEVVSDMQETSVEKPVLSVGVEYNAEKEVEVSLKTLNEYKNANPENTMGAVLQETLECPYSVEEWEVL